MRSKGEGRYERYPMKKLTVYEAARTSSKRLGDAPISRIKIEPHAKGNTT